MSRSTRLGLLAAGLLVASGTALSLPASAGTPGATFSAPLILAGGGAEPSIRVPTDGQSAAYVSAPSGLGSNFWRITERKNRNGSFSFVQSPVQQPDLGTGGGDSEISVGNKPVGQSRCDTIAYSGLHNIDLLNNFTVATSTDCGKTFALTNPYATQNTLTDRQWQTFDGAKTNFLIYHKVDTSQIVVSESFDGGQTYVSLSPDGTRGIIDAQTLPAVAQSNQVGNIVTDYSHPTGANNLLSGEPIHRMYATFGGAADALDNAQAALATAPGSNYNHVDTIYLAVSDDGGLTWTDHKVYSVNPASNRELNMLFPVVDVDKAGNVYVAWADAFKVQYAASTDGGKTFGRAHQVNHDNRRVLPGTGANLPDPGKSDLFPWIAAGANGLLDVIWYHGQGGAPTSNLAHRDPGDKNTQWTVAFAQFGQAASPTKPKELTYSEAITPVVHRGDICQNGTLCSLIPVAGAPFSAGDRSLLDFFEVAIDKAGRANIALADNADSPGSLNSAYIRQTGGYSLKTGEKLPIQRIESPQLLCTPDALFTDPSGDATQFVVPTPLPNQPALDIVSGWMSHSKKTNAITVYTKVLDLSQDPPALATGEQFEFTFTYNHVAYTAVASHDATQSADAFHMESPLRTSVGGGLTGEFDRKTNEIRVHIPGNFFAQLNKGPVVGKGATFTGLAITSRRNDAGLIVPNADTATSLGCPFIVGGAPQAPKPPTKHSSARGGAAVDAGSTNQGLTGLTVASAQDSRTIPGMRRGNITYDLPTGLAVIALGGALGLVVARRRKA